MAAVTAPRLEALRDLLERPLVLALAAVVAVVATALVTLSVDASIARAREDVRRHAAMLDAARARVRETTNVGPRSAAPVPDADASAERVLRARGIAYRKLERSAQDDAAQGLVIDAVPFDVLAGALDALAREAQLRAVEANVVARVEPGVVRAELRLTRAP